MVAGVLKLGNGTMPVYQTREKANLPSLAGRNIRCVFRPRLPDVINDICRYDAGIQKCGFSIVLILIVPLTSKQTQSNRSLENSPIGQPGAVYRIANALGGIAGNPVPKCIFHCTEGRTGLEEKVVAALAVPYRLRVRPLRNEVS